MSEYRVIHTDGKVNVAEMLALASRLLIESEGGPPAEPWPPRDIQANAKIDTKKLLIRARDITATAFLILDQRVQPDAEKKVTDWSQGMCPACCFPKQECQCNSQKRRRML